MSRLDIMIERLQAQRRCLALAHRLLKDRPGLILELLGLGHGRTWDHIRLLFPEHTVFVFERAPALAPDLMPRAQHLIVGEVRDTLERFAAEATQPIILAHADLGSGNPARDGALANWLAPVLGRIVPPGGLVLCDMPLMAATLTSLAPPPSVSAYPYYLYRQVRRLSELRS